MVINEGLKQSFIRRWNTIINYQLGCTEHTNCITVTTWGWMAAGERSGRYSNINIIMVIECKIAIANA